MSGPRPKPTLPPTQLTIVWQSVSLLLDYPDEDLLARVALIRSASHGLPTAIGEPIRTFLSHLESTPLPQLQADYVATFDTRRRCNLFLTYFAHGDTRKRGMALLRFKQTGTPPVGAGRAGRARHRSPGRRGTLPRDGGRRR